MSSPLIAGRRTRLSGRRFARALLGFRARRADARNLCIGKKLRGERHPSASPGAGGMRNVGWQKKFKEAVAECTRETRKEEKK